VGLIRSAPQKRLLFVDSFWDCLACDGFVCFDCFFFGVNCSDLAVDEATMFCVSGFGSGVNCDGVVDVVVVETLLQIVTLQEADFGSKGVEEGEASHFPHIRRLMEEILAENACLTLQDLAVNGRDLMELGITGRAIGETLHSLLAQVIDEQLPNDRAALLAAIQK
jgi:hypothetical protein